MKRILPLLVVISLLTISCKKDGDFTNCQQQNTQHSSLNQQPHSRTAAASMLEDMESGSKTSYASATVSLSSGSWTFNDALIGNLSTDKKNGTKSARVQNTGSLRMNFNLTNGASSLSLAYAAFGTDALTSSFELWASTNSGSTWSKVGSTINVSSGTLSTTTFTMNFTGNVRFEIRKTAGGTNRINIDDITVQDNVVNTTPTRDNNMGMGNPSGATTATSNSTNFLMDKSMYVLSYNSTKGTPNWVSWHLSPAWKGTAPRSTSFQTDNTLPAGYYRVTTSDYTNSGFDRGHMCPSEDRDFSSAENQVTFTMTNIVPQAPTNNQQTWRLLEEYCRTLMNAGNELYIISGPMGQGGSGSNGGTTNTIAGGNVTVPAFVWKVIVVLPTGSNDASRVSTSTRVIAVKMPNTQSINSTNWGQYRVSVDNLESTLGYDFLSNVPASIQSVIESTIDSGPTQ